MKGYGARVDALIDRLGSDLTEHDFADLAMACLDRAGCTVGEQLAVMRLVDHRTSGVVIESLRQAMMGPAPQSTSANDAPRAGAVPMTRPSDLAFLDPGSDK